MYTTFTKWLLFISSYFPLYIFLLFKSIHFIPTKKVDLLSFYLSQYKNESLFYNCIIILIIISIVVCIWLVCSKGNSRLKIQNIKNGSQDVLNYFIIYIIPILSMDSSNLKNILLNGFIFFMIGIMYVRSDLLYLNPLLILAHYRIYSCGDLIIISKKKVDEFKVLIDEGKDISVKEIAENIYLERNKG
jgi:hypothetical protein